MAIALTTELDAINTCLAVIGESPVNSVTNTGLVDAVTARNTLYETLRQVQSTGWSWNTDYDYVLQPQFPLPGEIRLPANTLTVDAMDPSLDYVQRGLRLYDRGRKTYTFDANVTVRIIRLLDFEEMPQVARHFVMVRAARIFQDRTVGSTTLSTFNKEDELRALVALRNDEATNRGYSIYNNSDARRILGWPRIPNRTGF
ncbi:hypothetical protein AB6806_23860 [Bosea sp. RCC_152_1]|uniref:hypothetical protein n=1 Tax=Bosea sp. RCC_152_1 TaxID=3239228 RepID=UPI00352366C7